MFLQNLIKKCINQSTFYTKSANLIDKNIIENEYLHIKNYLLNNFKNDSIIAISLEKNYKYILTMLACMEIGLTYIPLKKEFPQNRIDQIQKLSSFDYLIDDLILESILKKNQVIPNLKNFTLNKDKALYIIFTSGSTGEPKGVIIQRDSFENFTKWVDSYFCNITNNDKLLNTADFTFDLSLLDIALLISKNLNFYISNFNGNVFKLAAEIEKYQISTMATVPNNFNLLLNDDIYKKCNISKLQNLLLGGARFSYGIYQNFKTKLPNANIYNLYGPTEATVYCTAVKLFRSNKEDELIDKTVTIGKPILNMKILILDKNMNNISPYEKGDVYIEGIQVMSKYLNNPQKTNETLLQHNNQTLYRTGDIGLRDKNENLYITGRSDDTIKVEGYRVNLSDIDSYIHAVTYVVDCATVAIEDKIKENILVLYIKVNQEVSKKELQQELHNILPTYQIPQKIFFVDKFPLNNSGKISKKDLIKIYQNR